MRKLVDIKAHLNNNKQDMSAKRGHQLTESKIRRLEKYYHSSKKIPDDWKYNPKQAKLMFE